MHGHTFIKLVINLKNPAKTWFIKLFFIFINSKNKEKLVI